MRPSQALWAHVSPVVMVLAVATVSLLTLACGRTEDAAQEPPPPTPLILLKESHGGFLPLSAQQLIAVEVVLYPIPFRPEKKVSRIFQGDDAVRVLDGLGLASPKNSGVPSALSTGKIIFAYRTLEGIVKNRTFDLLISRLFADRDHPEVTYQSPIKIDESWLERAPNFAEPVGE